MKSPSVCSFMALVLNELALIANLFPSQGDMCKLSLVMSFQHQLKSI